MSHRKRTIFQIWRAIPNWIWFPAGLEEQTYYTTPVEIENLKQYACYLGLAFQILDDVLDSTCSLEDMGKDPNLDDGKPTFVNLLGIHAAASRITEHLEAAASYIGKFYKKTDYFDAILQNLDTTLNSCLDTIETA